jgi:hypothetical protein
MDLPRIAAPRVARVKQFLPGEHIDDIRTEMRERLLGAGLRDRVRPGASIAITAGSRGLGGIVEILSGAVDAVREAGGEPFIIPAMGSHGGATDEGQEEILRRIGVTEETVGAPVRSSMDTIELGRASNGAMAHLDRLASEADGIIVLGRVKTHPESAGELAAGLLKMTTIGLGKQRGARQAHSHVLWDSVRAVPRVTLGAAKVIFGIAVVENGFRRPIAIEVVPPVYDAFLEADRRLLNLAKAHLATLPFDRLDLLVIDEIGKNIAGTGMDPNVVGRWRVSGGPHIPDLGRIVVLSLSHPSLGNGIGIGMADYTTERFARAFDPTVTYINVITASEPGGNSAEGHLPMALGCDRDVIEVGLYTALAGDRPRLCRISDTDRLDELWVSEALLEEVRANPKLEVIEEPVPMAFDPVGNLLGV